MIWTFLQGEFGQGWVSEGKLQPRFLPGKTFWASVVRCASAATGVCADRVATSPKALFRVGPWGGLGVLDGSLPELLSSLPPVSLVLLSPCAERAGIGLSRGVITRGFRAATEGEVRRAFWGGEELPGVDTQQAEIARAWVRSLAVTLERQESRSYLVRSLAESLVRSYLPPQVRAVLGLPLGGEPTGVLGKRLSAVYFSLAAAGTLEAARQLLFQCQDPDRMLDVAGNPGPWPTTYPSVVRRLRVALASEEFFLCPRLTSGCTPQRVRSSGGGLSCRSRIDVSVSTPSSV